MTKKRRRGKGEGSVFKTADGRWRGAITVGYDTATGRQKQKYFSGKTKREVQKKVRKAVTQIEEGTYVEPSEVTVKNFLDDWLEERKPFLSHSSWRTYKGIIKHHLNPSLGRIRLQKLEAKQVQEMINKKLEGERADGRTGELSLRMVRYIVQTLSTALKVAVKRNLINKNVASLSDGMVEIEHRKKKAQKREMRILDKKEIRQFLNSCKKSRHYAAYLLALSTGIRLGELLGLPWSEVDFKKTTITVKQQVRRTDEGLIIDPILKTKESIRVIKIPELTAKELLKQKKRIGKEKLSMGSAYQNNDLVFCNEEGNPYDPRNFLRYFKRDLKEAGLPEKEIRFHDLRHSFATLSLQEGVSPKRVQKVLGHTTIKTTLDLYSHVTEEIEDHGAKAINKVLVEYEI